MCVFHHDSIMTLSLSLLLLLLHALSPQAEDAWRLRDAGCNSVWASEVLFKFGMNDGEHAMSVIRAMKSKGSVKYARASGAYVGRGEGAKEFLATIEV